MLQIAICDDIPAYQQIIQSEIEKVLKLSHKITFFPLAKSFWKSFQKENVLTRLCSWISISEQKTYPGSLLRKKFPQSIP